MLAKGPPEQRITQALELLRQHLNLLLPLRLTQLRIRIKRRPLRMRPRLVQRLGQFAFAPGFVLRRGDLNAVHRRMPTGIQRLQQLPLAQRQQPQHAVIDSQFSLAL